MSFRAEAIAFVKKRAAQAAMTGDFDFVSLAAYLFAIGCQLQLNHGNPRLLIHDDTVSAWTSEEELLDQLTGLSAGWDLPSCS